MKKLLLLCMLSVLLLTGCSNRNNLKEGDCPVTVFFHDIPEEFTMLDENIQKMLKIVVVLHNDTTEKTYEVPLSYDQDFSYTAMLHPGTYRVESVSTRSNYANLTFSTGIKELNIIHDTESFIPVKVANKEEFTNHWMQIQPMPEIILAEKFSRTIQLNRKIVAIQEIISELDCDATTTVIPGKKEEIPVPKHGLTITVLNRAEKSQLWRDCDVIALEVGRGAVVFPKGVTTGTSPKAICHKDTGAYGAPDKFKGSVFFGFDIYPTHAIYLDPISGDKITIGITSNGSAISFIRYELEVFE